MDPSALDDDTVTYEELYQSYVNFWNSLNNCLEDEDKMVPANGINPTYQEAKQLWKSMKIPRRRKLLWIATGFIHSEFPDDEEAFRREKAEGLINETNVTTGANAEDESSDDDYNPDLDEENIASANNVNGDNDAFQRETPLSITQATAPAGITDSIPPVISPIQSQTNLSSPAHAATPINEIIVDLQPDAWVETVREDDDVQDHDMEESNINSPQSPAHADENDVTAASQVSNGSDSSVYPLSQTINVPKQNTPKRNRVIIYESDDENNAYDGVKDEDIETSYMDEQIASPSEESSSSSPPVQRRASKCSGKAVTKRRRRKSPKPSTSSQSRTILTRSATREITNQKARKTVTRRGRRSDLESDENILSDSDDNRKRKTLIQSLCNSLDAEDDSGSDESSSSSDTRSHGYIVNDNKTDEESSDEDVTYSDSQQNPHSDDVSSSIDDEIYTLDDSVERDLPTAPPKAIVRNTPTTTQKTTPFLAHVGKSRYASDIPITPARPSIVTPSSTNMSLQGRTITAPQHEAATPNSSTAVARGFGQVSSVDPNHIRPQISEAAAGRIRTRSNKRQQPPADTPQNQLKTHAQTPGHQPASSMTRQTSTKEPPISSTAPADTRRSTSSVRLGSLIRDGSDNSRPSSVNSMNSSVREGYELIEKDCKLFVANTLIIIYVINGKKYFRRYRPLGSGRYNEENACNDFLCTKCEKLGKSTFVKILKRNNKTYAEVEHALGCQIREYNLDDD